MLHKFLLAISIVTISALYAQTSPDDFPAEPDKTMALARESLLRGDAGKASGEIQKAALWVKRDSDKVVADSKATLENAARELEKLGEDLKKGVPKSDAELKKVFARIDYALATGWRRTAEQSGKGSGEALKKAGAALLGAAKWSATELDGGAHSPLNAFEESDQTLGADLDAHVQEPGKGSKGTRQAIVEEARKP